MTDAFGWVDAELRQLEQAGLRRTRRLRTTVQGVYTVLDGQSLINFGSNDYLGLASQLQISDGWWQRGWGSGASPLVCGYSDAHRQLEQTVAAWEGSPAALVFSSGYAANVGTVSALVGPEDVILSDQFNHASIIDGCRLSRARVIVYRHADVDHLRECLEQAKTYRRRLIVTDSVFSMDGDVAPLRQIAELAERYDCMVVVDEAHATGVYGTQGTGMVEAEGLAERLPLRVGTFSKALGCVGGFVVGPAAVIEWLTHRARSYFFSTAMPDICAEIARRAVDAARQAHLARQHLQNMAASVRSALAAQGWNTGSSSTHIIPVILGEPGAVMEATQRLAGEGVFVPGIRPPSVPPGQSLLRISLSAAHRWSDIEKLIGAMQRLRTWLQSY
jgi:8-amino-7-oxononanoate synthase